MQNTIGKYTAGFGIALAITILFTSLLVIVKENSKGLMSLLTAMLGHHWTTHGVVTIILFVVLGALFSGLRIEESWGIDARRLWAIILAATIVGGLIIVGFFLLHL